MIPTMASGEGMARPTTQSRLLKYNAMVKMSQLIKERAEEELADIVDRNDEQLNQFLTRLETKSLMKQTVNLWKKSATVMINECQYKEAGDCLRFLSEVIYNYGSEEHKSSSLQSLLNCSQFYIQSNETERAIIALKQALSQMELSPEIYSEKIIENYEKCINLYKSIGNTSLQHLNQEIKRLFVESQVSNNGKEPNSELPIQSFSNDSQFNSSIQTSNYMNSGLDSDSSEQIDDKVLVWKKIKEMKAKNAIDVSPNFSPESDSYCETSDDENTDLGPILTKPSKELLVQNLKRFTENNCLRIQTSDVEDCSQRKRHSEPILEKRQLTTEITTSPLSPPLKSEDLNEEKPKPKRKRKPFELSEENAVNRLAKLNRENIKHYYIEDSNDDQQKLYCQACNISVKCYRYSTITDHLNSKKHELAVIPIQNAFQQKNLQIIPDEALGYTFYPYPYTFEYKIFEVNSEGHKPLVSQSVSDQDIDCRFQPNSTDGSINKTTDVLSDPISETQTNSGSLFALNSEEFPDFHILTAPTNPDLYINSNDPKTHDIDRPLRTPDIEMTESFNLFYKTNFSQT